MGVLAKLKKTDHHILPVTETALRQSWERMVRRAGVKDFCFHDFRHEAISRFFEMGLSVPEVALISGHKLAMHRRCLSVTLLESYRACL